MKFTWRRWLLCLGILMPAFAYAQDPADEITSIVPPNPEVGTLGNYGGFNSNLSVGQIDITIPLVEVKSSSLSMPFSLSYDPTGIRVFEKASTVGMNWHLSGTSSISRVVLGKPDDLSGNFNSALIQDSINSAPNSTRIVTDPNDFWYNAAKMSFDLEPDMYSYNFNGKSGKFIFSPSENKFITIPYAPLKIERLWNSSTSFFYFKITDENGYVFIFDELGTASFQTEVLNSPGGFSSMTYTSEWHLSEVDAPDGNWEYRIHYIPDSKPVVSDASQTMNYLISGGCSGGPQTGIMDLTGSTWVTSEINYGGKLIARVNAKQEEAIFDYSTLADGSMQLDRIRYRNGDGISIREQLLNYSFYAGSGKLRLDSVVTFADKDRQHAYGLYYDLAKNTPVTGSKARDHWGYYNGQNGNTSLVPRMWYSKQYVGSANRNASLDFAKAGILNKIVYPTGGYSEFEYELNDYGRIQVVSQLVNTAVVTPKTVVLTKLFPTDGGGPFTTTFTITHPQVVKIATAHDNCEGEKIRDRNALCDPEHSGVHMTMLEPVSGDFFSLNGPEGEMKNYDLMLDHAGTYTITMQMAELHDYGFVKINYEELTGYRKTETAGGLRIKTVTNNDGFGNLETRSFTYVDANEADRSSGIILNEPYYTAVNQSGVSCTIIPGSPFPGCNKDMLMFKISDNSNRQLLFANGNIVSYQRVLEKIGGSGEGGYIDHRFSYTPDKIISVFPFPAPTPQFYKRGLPVLTRYLDNTQTLKKEEENLYEASTSNKYSIKGLKIGFSKSCSVTPIGNTIKFEPIEYKTEWYYPKRSISREYNPNSATPIETSVEYFYDNPAHCNATRTIQTNSDGSQTITRTKYANDYDQVGTTSDAAASAMTQMLNKHMINAVWESSTGTIRGGVEQVSAASVQTYKTFATDRIYPWKQYRLNTENPISRPAGGFSSIANSNTFQVTGNVLLEKELEAYSIYGAPLSIKKEHGNAACLIWNYQDQKPSAVVTNAGNGQVAYSSFEADEEGNWEYNDHGIVKYTSFTGDKAFDMKGGTFSPLNLVDVNGQPAVGNYLVTYWSKNDGDVTVNGSSPTFTGETANGWTYYEHLVTNTSQLTLVGGSTIDELRAYPETARMKTFTYRPLIGVTSICDENNKVANFTYDFMGKLLLVKDQNGNILTKHQYGIQAGE